MNRPKVILQVTASIDGRIALMPNLTMFSPIDDSLTPYLLKEEDWKFFDNGVKSLHEVDCCLEGSNMLVSEGDELKVLPKSAHQSKDLLYRDYLPESIINREGRKTWTSVVDGRGRFRNGYRACDDNPETYMIHLTSYGAPEEYLAFLQEKEIPYILSGTERVDLAESFDKLHRILNVKCILTTSGGKLAGALIRDNLLDEINILYNPVIYGGSQNPTLFHSPDITSPGVMPSHLKYISSQVFGSGSIWVRYEVVKR